jgi:putative DNA-invertase from lambdoid prophage Rac
MGSWTKNEGQDMKYQTDADVLAPAKNIFHHLHELIQAERPTQDVMREALALAVGHCVVCNVVVYDQSVATDAILATVESAMEMLQSHCTPEAERARRPHRVKSGLAAAKARGVVLSRQEGQRPSDKKAKKVLKLHEDGLSYRLIGRNVGLSKNTVMDIVRRRPG